MDWLLEHNEDPDIDEPYQPPTGHKLNEETATLPQGVVFVQSCLYQLNWLMYFAQQSINTKNLIKVY